MTDACHHCGHDLDGNNPNVRFNLPDTMLGVIDDVRSPQVWMDCASAYSSNLMRVHLDDVPACFVRAMFPIRMMSGHTATFGVWVAVREEVLNQAFDVWNKPEYTDFAFDGWLANRLPMWEVFGKRLHAEVRNPNHKPTCVSSPHADLSAALTKQWPDELVRELMAAYQ